MRNSDLLEQLQQKDVTYVYNLSGHNVLNSLINLKQLTFEVTDACNLKCKYCGYGDFYETHGKREDKFLQFDVAKRLIDYLYDIWTNHQAASSPHKIVFGFYGGEPLMNMSLIEQIVAYLESLPTIPGVKYGYAMTTNGMLLDRYMSFLAEKEVMLLLSLDGDEYAQGYRVDHRGANSFQRVFHNMKLLQSTYPEYFAEHVSFNSVIHDKNNDVEVLKFIIEHFNKRPRLAELNNFGISEAKKEEFRKMFRSAQTTEFSCADSDFLYASSDVMDLLIFVPVSAHTGEGIENLLEMILLTAEVSELKANPNREARGLVIEAQLDKCKGPVATILVQKGTLHVGDFIAAGACNGKVRAMMDDKGRRVKEAGPSTPVEILGLGDVPNAGEILMSFESDKEAKNFAGAFVTENKSRLLEETKGKLSLDNLFDQIQASDLKELPIIVKADVQGSVEAVKQSLTKLSNEEVIVKVIHGGVGAINESDVSLAATSNAIIIGFNVRPDTTAKQLAEQEGVDLRLYKVIYQAIEDVEAAMKGMLDPVFEEKVIGHAEVRQLFKASGVGTIAGSYVLDGTFQRNCKVRITRGEDQIFEGELASLKRFKDDVKEVRAGYECGLVFNDFNDVKEEDKVEAYIMVEVPR